MKPPHVSDIIAKTNDDFSHDRFELENFILAQKLMFITPSTFRDFPFLAYPPRLFQPPRLLDFFFHHKLRFLNPLF